MAFPYHLDFTGIDFRRHPACYEVGRGEQGVLLVEPYKSELLAHWAFRTPEVAAISAGNLLTHYLHYRDQGDFVGMDMARKFVQMGYTRARRYANWRGGRKRRRDGSAAVRGSGDPRKAISAALFKAVWDIIRADPRYRCARRAHDRRAGSGWGRRRERGERGGRRARHEAGRCSRSRRPPSAAVGARKRSGEV